MVPSFLGLMFFLLHYFLDVVLCHAEIRYCCYIDEISSC